MDGSSHLSDDELMSYETEFIQERDDSSNSEEEEEEVQDVRILSFNRNGRGPMYGTPSAPPSGSGPTTRSGSRPGSRSSRTRGGASTSNNISHTHNNEYLTDDDDSMNRSNGNNILTDDED